MNDKYEVYEPFETSLIHPSHVSKQKETQTIHISIVANTFIIFHQWKHAMIVLHPFDRWWLPIINLYHLWSIQFQIEREKADLSVQVIQMSERLEEAEGGAESQFNINRNRDAELMKLRKLLDDVHLESEESAHLLKKKHQEIVNDYQEQVDILTKAKSR